MQFLTQLSHATIFTLKLTLLFFLSASSIAQAQQCTGSRTITRSSGSSWQSGRLIQNGISSRCSSAKSFPGVADTDLRRVDVYFFVNHNDTTACITVTLNAGTCTGSNALFSTAYSPYYAGDLSQNYIADIGASANPSRSYSFNVPAGARFDVTVNPISSFGSCNNYTLTVSGFGCPPVSPLLISEFRFGVDSSAPNAARDEYIELYNNTDAPLTVNTTDGSAGYALVASDGAVRFIVPNGTVIPARGHYLGANSVGYSLGGYPTDHGATATPDATYTANIPFMAGIALFRTADPAGFTLANRLDAFGYFSAPDLYREIGFSSFPVSSSGTNFFYVRKMGVAARGLPQDTGDNENDFVLTTLGSDYGATLGAPGPENLSSPIQRNAQLRATLLDPMQSAAGANNRARNSTPNQAICGGNCPLGTLSIRRTYTNNTGQPVTRLRFRIVDITTVPESTNNTGTADIRVLSRTGSFTVTRVDGSQVTVQGLTLEQPPNQPNGGGLNSSLSAPTITLETPLAVADDPSTPNARENTITVEFLLGVVQLGNFSFFVNVEALP